MDLLKYIKEWLCKAELAENAELRSKLADELVKAQSLQLDLKESGKEKEALIGRVNELVKEVEKLQTERDPHKAIREELNDSHPKARILHTLPVFVKDGQVVQEEIPLQSFVGDFYDLHRTLKSKGLTLEQYKNENPDAEETALFNKLAFDIYKHTRIYVKYKYDIKKYGWSEFWQLPQLTFVLGEGDCEDSTNLLLSWFKAAGLPAFMFRNTCGMSKGGGHSTCYAYDFKDKIWRHLEATATSCRSTSFHNLPSKKKKDRLWIDDVWFSFNWENSWHVFETNAAEDTFPENFRIIPQG